MTDKAEQSEVDRVFEQASGLFALLSAPLRLKILHCLCGGERSVGEILAFTGSSQPNVSQHLALMHRAGVLGRRRRGTTVLYRIVSDRAVSVCRSVCTQIALEFEESAR
jgi:ArsR family transcriptional regulator